MRILRAQTGEPLVRAVQIKIFYPGNKRSALQVHRAPPGNGLTPQGIDSLLASTAAKIEKTYPGFDYGLVQVGPASFNFVSRGPAQIDESN